MKSKERYTKSDLELFSIHSCPKNTTYLVTPSLFFLSVFLQAVQHLQHARPRLLQKDGPRRVSIWTISVDLVIWNFVQRVLLGPLLLIGCVLHSSFWLVACCIPPSDWLRAAFLLLIGGLLHSSFWLVVCCIPPSDWWPAAFLLLIGCLLHSSFWLVSCFSTSFSWLVACWWPFCYFGSMLQPCRRAVNLPPVWWSAAAPPSGWWSAAAPPPGWWSAAAPPPVRWSAGAPTPGWWSAAAPTSDWWSAAPHPSDWCSAAAPPPVGGVLKPLLLFGGVL